MSVATASARARLLSSAAEAAEASRSYAASLTSGVIERDRAGSVPWAALSALDASGLLGITVPVAHGGPELSPVVLAEVIRTIAAVDPAIARVPQAHFLFVDALATLGSVTQQQRLFAEVLAGARLGNGMAERGGQHAQDLKTRLHRTPGGLRLDGRKYYCTGAISARWIGVTALDEADRLVLAFVERDAPGVHVDEDWNVMGQRATVSGSAAFDHVPVDPAWSSPTSRHSKGRSSSACEPSSCMPRSRSASPAARCATRRNSSGQGPRPFFEATRAGRADAAADVPHTIHRFGELATRVRAAEALLTAAAAMLEEVGRQPRDTAAAARGSIAVAQARAFGCETAVAVASDLFALTGTSAADERYDLSRHWRNARTHASHDPVDWKYHHIGNYLLSDVPPPNHGQL